MTGNGELDAGALLSFLRWHLDDGQLPGLRLDEPLHITPLPDGRTHRTTLVRAGGAELVLRRPLAGPHSDGTHDVAREYSWLTALHPVFPLAPRPYLFCEDAAVLGVPFSVVERRRGLVAGGDEPMPLAGHPHLRRGVSEAVVETLARLHDVDTGTAAFADLGSPVGVLDRTVREWTDRWRHVRLGPVPAMDTLALWLTAHQPPDSLDPAVVHGDFRLEHILLNPLRPSEPVAVLDWETASLGDPLADLGGMLAWWTGPDGAGSGDGERGVTGRPGYFSRAELIDAYARRSGRDVSSVAYFEVLAHFRRAVGIQQRSAAGGGRAPDAAVRVAAVAAHALSLASEA